MVKIFPSGKDEIFILRPVGGFNITAAKKMIEKNPRGVTQVPIQQFKSYINTVFGVRVDKEYAKTVGISEPGIMAYFQFPDGNFYWFPIDGWHRIWKKLENGEEYMDFYELTNEEVSQVKYQ